MRTLDQAATLRTARAPSAGGPTVVAIGGGKGGVGKSTLAANLARIAAEEGARPLLVDGDFGMADLSVLLGTSPTQTIESVLAGGALDDAVAEVHGFAFLAGANGSDRLTLTEPPLHHLKAAIARASGHDLAILDTPPGIAPSATAVAALAPLLVAVITPDTTSLVDAYAWIKLMVLRHGARRVAVLPNQVRHPGEGARLFGQLERLVQRFLGFELSSLPEIPFDARLLDAARRGRLLAGDAPDAPAIVALRRTVRVLRAEPWFGRTEDAA